MLDKLGAAIEDYQAKWEELVSQRSNKPYFAYLKPVAAGWKVADRNEYDRLYLELHDACDKTVETWMNGRWIAKMHLRDGRIPMGIRIIKLMQRRPDSKDAVGLDHVDFYANGSRPIADILTEEKDLKWTEEHNDAIDSYGWLSLWFGGTEAKIKNYTVVDTVIRELQELNGQIID